LLVVQIETMQRKGKFQLLISILNISILVVTGIAPVFAYVMESNNYHIQSDSINVGGTDNQTSANYKMSDTIGEIASGESGSTNYKLKAGYRQMQETYISLTSPGNINMGSISLSQDDVFGTGSAWTVKTDNPAGYVLTFKTDQANSMDSGTDQFTDYTEASTGTPDSWSVDAANYEFGFSAYGDDVATAKWGDNTSCGSGSTPDGTLKWMGFTGITAITIATSSSRTTTSGTDTTLCVGAEQGINVFAPDGNYTASITATVITQ